MKLKRYIQPAQFMFRYEQCSALAFDVNTSGVDEVEEGEVGAKERDCIPEAIWQEKESEKTKSPYLW